MDWRGFAQQMASLARDLLAQETVEATLERITAAAVELVEGCDESGILVLSGEKVHSLAPTGRLVVDSDRLQELLGEGPCFDAARHTVGEAMGIVMGSHHLTEEQAFDVLRRHSQEHNIKLREVARRVCEKGSV